MDLGLNGKIVLVTGGSKGIGLACARAFLQEGARVAIVSRTGAIWTLHWRSWPRRRMTSLQCQPILHAVNQPRAMVKEVEARLGAIDILVNSAGAAKRYLAGRPQRGCLARSDGREVLHVHSRDRCRAAGHGGAWRRDVVINIIGMGGKVATPIHLPGGAANSALMLATVGLANVYGPKGIRINAINPGATMTDRVKEALKLEAKARRCDGRGSAGARSGDGAAAQRYAHSRGHRER